MLQDPNVDGVMVILTPQTSTEIDGDGAGARRGSAASATKPVLACWMGEQEVISRAVDMLAANDVPNYPFPERAVAALGAMYRYWQLAPAARGRHRDV